MQNGPWQWPDNLGSEIVHAHEEKSLICHPEMEGFQRAFYFDVFSTRGHMRNCTKRFDSALTL